MLLKCLSLFGLVALSLGQDFVMPSMFGGKAEGECPDQFAAAADCVAGQAPEEGMMAAKLACLVDGGCAVAGQMGAFKACAMPQLKSFLMEPLRQCLAGKGVEMPPGLPMLLVKQAMVGKLSGPADARDAFLAKVQAKMAGVCGADFDFDSAKDCMQSQATSLAPDACSQFVSEDCLADAKAAVFAARQDVCKCGKGLFIQLMSRKQEIMAAMKGCKEEAGLPDGFFTPERKRQMKKKMMKMFMTFCKGGDPFADGGEF